MSDQSDILPLFPLPTVLFPGMPFPLHIFEQRYRDMVQTCIDQDRPFGIVRTHTTAVSVGGTIDATDLHPVGCACEVLSVLKRHPGGEFDVLTRGRHRFVLHNLVDSGTPYTQGRVSWFDDGPETSGELAMRPMLISRVIDLVRQLAARPDAPSDLLEKVTEQSPARPSFVFGRTLGFPLDFQCRLLDSRSEANRLQQIASRLEAMWLEVRIRREHRRTDATPDWPGKSSYGFAGPTLTTDRN